MRASALLLLLAAVRLASAQVGWQEMPDTRLVDQCPPANFGGSNYNFPAECKSVVGAWGGGAYDPGRQRIYLWGGGHHDYYGNEVYALDVAAGAMLRLTDPGLPLADPDAAPSDSELAPYDGTQPNSRHTYGGMAFIAHADRLWAFTGALAGRYSGVDDLTWIFDPTSRTWRRDNPTGDVPAGESGIVAAYDPVSRKVFVHNRLGLYSYEYRPEGGHYTRLNTDAGLALHAHAVIDPERRLMFVFGRGNHFAYSIADGSNYQRIQLDPPGGNPFLEFQAPGLAYDPVDGKVVAWTGDGRIYRLDTETFTWESTAFQSGPGAAYTQGTYGRFVYVPERDEFAVVNLAQQNAYRFRPPRGASDASPPQAPTGVAATSSLPTVAHVTWNAASDNFGVDGYRVYRDDALVADTRKLEFRELGLSASTTYRYHIVAYDSAGLASPASSPVNLTTAARTVTLPVGNCASEPGLAGRSDVVLCEPWEDTDWWTDKGYLADPIVNDPRPATAAAVERVEIVSEPCFSGNCLKVNMLQGITRGLSLYWPLAAAEEAPEEMFVRYYLRLGPNWNADMCDGAGNVVGQGGKFPGPADLRTWADVAGQCGNGGAPGDGLNCWSMRSAYFHCNSNDGEACATKPDAATRFGSYIYHPNQAGSTGDLGLWDEDDWNQGERSACDTDPGGMGCGIGDGGVLERDRWYRIEMQVKMNTPGSEDGVIRGWVDGVLSYEKTNMQFRKPNHDLLHNRLVWLNVFKGGVYGNCNDHAVYLDQLVVSTDAPPGGVNSDTTQPPSLTLQASPTRVSLGEDVNLSWQTDQASSCEATGAWSGTRSTQGSENATPADATTRYVLECEGPGGRVVRSVSIDVEGGAGGGGGGGADTTSPSTPGTPAVIVLTDQSVQIEWGASTDDGGVAGYRLFRNDLSLGTLTETSFTDADVAPGATYRYTVEAVDLAGNLSARSAALVLTTHGEGGGGDSGLLTLFPDSDTYTEPTTSQTTGDLPVMNLTPGSVAYLRFPLDALPEGAFVRSARLRLYDAQQYGDIERVGVFRANRDWHESVTTRTYVDRTAQLVWTNELGDWVDRNGVEQGEASYAEQAVADTNTGRWIDFDVTGLVREWANGSHANQGLALRATGAGGLHALKSAESEDTLLRPRLEVILGTEGGAQSAQVILQDGLGGYAGTRDTHLTAAAPTAPAGAARSALEANGQYVPLVGFDIFQSEGGPVPDGATIDAAVLSLYKHSYYDHRYAAHRLLRSWQESGASWQHSGTSPWSTPGAGSAGSDYLSSADAETDAGFQPGWVDFDVASAVQAMAAGASNHGWRLRPLGGNNNLKRFRTREHATDPSLRPRLAISYTTGSAVEQGPLVHLLGPGPGSHFPQGNAIAIDTQVLSGGAPIARVEFHADGNLIGQRTDPPYTFAWTGASPGEHVLHVVAHDDAGGSGRSFDARITVVSSDLPPVADLDLPVGGSVLTQGVPTPLVAGVLDPEGALELVEFFVDGQSVGQRTGGPYTSFWTPDVPGTHVLHVVATDAAGNSTRSDDVSITVTAAANLPPQVGMAAPLDGATVSVGEPLDLSANVSDPDGSVVRVVFYVDGQSVGQSTSAPFSVPYLPTATGNRTLHAVAFDDDGASGRSTDVSVTVEEPSSGTVLLQQGHAGYDGARDAQIGSWGADSNGGALPTLLEARDQYAALLGFRIFESEGGPVPDGATIESATLGLYKYSAYDHVYAAHRLLAGWEEGEVTWNRRDAGNPWAAPGANAAGVDHHPDADGEAEAGFAPGWLEIDVTSGVQAMSDGAGNHGWRLLPLGGNNNLKRFHSSDHQEDASLRPRLSIVYGGVTSSNQSPQVQVVSPTPGTVLPPGGALTVQASATDPDGEVARVEFFVDGAGVGARTTAPYTLTWVPPGPGSYSLHAIATDDRGASARSADVVFESAAPEQPPTVQLDSPAAGTRVVEGQPLAIAATAADADGTVTAVRFYIDGSLVATRAAAPFSTSWTASGTGNHVLHATATDDDGNTARSADVAVVVDPANQPPQVTLSAPGAGTSVAEGGAVALNVNATDGDGAVVRVDYFIDGTLVASRTQTPFQASWTASQPGARILHAVATDDDGATARSADRAVQVLTQNQPPQVAIVTPAQGTTVSVGEPVAVALQISDADGTIASVTLFANGSVVGTSSQAPHTLTWTPGAAGSVALHAVAIDDDGLDARSSDVLVTSEASQPETVSLVLQQGLAGYSGSTDTRLSSWASDSAAGNSPALLELGGQYAALLRFAIFESEGGPVPDGARIDAATLELYKYSAYDHAYAAHRLRRGWDESSASWNHPATGSVWAQPGAAGVGTDIEARADGEGSVGFDPGWLRIDVVDGVRAMGSGGNHGWRLLPLSGNGNLKRFHSSEYGSQPALRPKLGLTYTVNQTPNQGPQVSLDSPAGGSGFEPGGAILLEASASDPDGSISRVAFIANGTVIGERTTPPYRLVWNGAAEGDHLLRARATDDDGAETLSAAVSIQVSAQDNTPPTIDLDLPLDGSTVEPDTFMAMVAAVLDPDGEVARVEFFVNGTSVGEDTAPPFFLLHNIGDATGDLRLHAVATDDRGATTRSADITVTVGADGGTEVPPTRETVVLQDGLSGYDGTDDAYLSWWTQPEGVGQAMAALEANGQYVPLLRFRIFTSEGGPVPDGAVIESAVLGVYKFSYYDHLYGAHRLLQPWAESEVSWLGPSYGQTWASPGAGTMGTDIAAQADGESLVGFEPGWLELDVRFGIQSMSDGSPNHGWRLVPLGGNGNLKRFYTSEFADRPELRPRLSITYSTGG